MSLHLVLGYLTLDEIKELLLHVRQIEQREPGRMIICWIEGLQGKSIEEVKKILREIFPARGMAA